ncbi:MAG TPA: DUF5719 family protein [Streptosporangiaceae bacterium]|jgi:hypothetical protein
MRIPAIGRFSLFGLVVLALAALFAVAALSKPATVSAGQQPPPQPPAVATVSGGARACPAPGAPGSHGTGVAVIAAAGPRAGSGQATVTRLGTAEPAGGGSSGGGGSASSAGSPLARPSQPGTLSVTGVPAAHAGSGGQAGHGSQPVSQPGGVAVQATGSMAQGLAVEQTGPGGAIAAACPGPGTSFWFTAPGEQHARFIKLYLMNADSQASDVDVDILTDTGPLQTGVDTGITVPAHGMVMQSVDTLVHGSRAIGLHVRTSAGRVAAALLESTSVHHDGQWLPAAQVPARQIVIPALPGAPGVRQLYVTNPGGSDAQVKLSMDTSNGSYQPAGTGSLNIAAGSASQLSLPSLTGVKGAIVLTSSVPVTASVMMPGAVPGTPGAMTAAAPAIGQQGVIADAGQSGETSTVELSAPDGAAKVRVATAASGLAAGGAAAGGGRVISIPAKRTATITLSRPAGTHGEFAAVLTPLPGSGPVYAGRVLTHGPDTVLAIMPVASALTSVPLPSIRSAPITAQP